MENKYKWGIIGVIIGFIIGVVALVLHRRN